MTVLASRYDLVKGRESYINGTARWRRGYVIGFPTHIYIKGVGGMRLKLSGADGKTSGIS